MKSSPDSIEIITVTPEEGESLRQLISLRGFDQIRCTPVREVTSRFASHTPALVLIDLGLMHTASHLKSLFSVIPRGVKSIVLADQFDEQIFLLCHDHGARDYLIKPVPEAYMVSRVIAVLQENRMGQLLNQKDEILIDLGVLSRRSGVFTMTYFIKQLEKAIGGASTLAPRPLDAMLASLLLLELQPQAGAIWPPEEWDQVYAEAARILKVSARGMDSVGEYFVDKFAVLLPNTPRAGADSLAKRLSEQLGKLSAVWRARNGKGFVAHVGIGEAQGCRHYEELLNQAAHNQVMIV